MVRKRSVRGDLVKNIIIAGPARAGKSTLARKIHEELGHFVIHIDKLVAVFGEAYPQLDIRLNWNRKKTTDHLAPFLGHFLGMFSSDDGHGLLPYSHGAVKGNHFVLEGTYLNFDIIDHILKTYGIRDFKEKFLLIGLVQNEKTVDAFVRDFKQYDTKDDWTYGFDDNDLKEIAEGEISFGRSMYQDLVKYGFTIYDTSAERERVYSQILADIKARHM